MSRNTPNPSQAVGEVLGCGANCPNFQSHHGDAQSMQVEGVDLPVAANVIDELDKPVDPEDTSDDQDGDEGAIFLNSDGGKRGGGGVPLRSLGRHAALMKDLVRLSLSLCSRECASHSIPHLLAEP